MVATALAIVSFALSIVQAVRARQRQKKLEKEAKRRQDLAKGFLLPVPSGVGELPVCYGRNLVGGVQVYHRVRGAFYAYNIYSPGDPSVGPNGVRWEHGLGSANVIGSKNEYLILQQALCLGPINRIVWLDIDERSWNDPYFKRSGADDPDQSQGGSGAHVINTYVKGGEVDPMSATNAGDWFGYLFPPVYIPGVSEDLPEDDRNRAKFHDCSYLAGVFKLNRDDPQFGGVPEVQAYIEGKLIHTIEGGPGNRTLSANKVYSNNPVLCLLDYLLNPLYGRGLSTEEIDLDSFYSAYRLCERVVKPAAPKKGKLWENTVGSHDVKLYECNITLATSAPVRENVENLLECMGLAELIWASGVYKLSLFYPSLYEEGNSYAADDVVQFSAAAGHKDLYRSLVENNTQPPAGLTPLPDGTYATNSNWAKDVIAYYLTDDDIDESGEIARSWPNAQERFNHVTVRFLDEAVNFKENTASWPFRASKIEGPSDEKGEWAAGEYKQSDIVIYNTQEYQLRTIDGYIYTSTIAPDVDPLWLLYDRDDVYNTFIREDGGLPLETEFFEAGTTDYYHALAKAEQRCRFSREQITYRFTGMMSINHLEPGDLIHVKSNTLEINSEIMRIEETKITNSGGIELTAVRFDATILAWNADDDQVVHAPSTLDTAVSQATGLTFDNTGSDISFTSGRLSWIPANDSRVKSYEVYYTLTPIAQVDAGTQWDFLGETLNYSYVIPPLEGSVYTVAVVAKAASGERAPRYDIATGSTWPLLSIGIDAITLGNWVTMTTSVYKESENPPTKPVGGVYDFDQLGLSVLPAGWLGAPPTTNAVDRVWVSTSIVSSLGGTGEVATDTWSAPSLFAEVSFYARLEPEVVGVLQDNTGENFDYSSANGAMRAFSGFTEITGLDTVSYAVEYVDNVSVALNNANGSVDKGKFQVTSLTGPLGSAIFKATYNGVEYFKTLTVTSIPVGYSRDLTPPPTPTNITVDMGFSNMFVVQEPEPSYTAGHGHKHIVVYRASFTSLDPLPVFADAEELGRFEGAFNSYGSEPGVQYRVWFKYESVDGILSAIPMGGTNGISATSNSDDVISRSMIKLAVIDSARIADAAITEAKIVNAAITEAKIENAAITSAKISNIIQSTVFNVSQGWEIRKDGSATFNNVKARGDIEATSINANAVNIVNTLHIQGNAVTLMTGAYSDTDGSGYTNQYTPANSFLPSSSKSRVSPGVSRSITIPEDTPGTPVIITGSAGWSSITDGSLTVYLRFLRNGTVIKVFRLGQISGTMESDEIIAAKAEFPASVTVIDYPSDGTHVYSVDVYAFSTFFQSTLAWNYHTITLLAGKR